MELFNDSLKVSKFHLFLPEALSHHCYQSMKGFDSSLTSLPIFLILNLLSSFQSSKESG